MNRSVKAQGSVFSSRSCVKLSLIFLFSAISCFSHSSVSAQVHHDTTVSFTVYGACSSCEDRILEAAEGRGVKQTRWDVDKQLFTVTYDLASTSLSKIKKRIVRAGHDTEDRKASNAVYYSLPDCCHYRELKASLTGEAVEDEVSATVDSLQQVAPQLNGDSAATDNIIRGVVLETTTKGEFNSLRGASVIWLGTTKGTATDSSGVFSLQRIPDVNRMVVSFAGYIPDTVEVGDIREFKVILGNQKKLSEVRITSKRRSTYLSTGDPFRMQVMTEKELYKAACCNLSESFETNPSVDVSYSDAVTGSKQIQLLGLSGVYTQLTVENQTGPRGIATAFGLNSIPGTWVESIQLNKGVGSVVNGYESIAGQINIELKKPDSEEWLYANAYVNDFGKVDLNLNLSAPIGEKWSTALLLHDDFFNNTGIDFNKDGFRDVPTGNNLSVSNRWKYDDQKGLVSQFGIRYYNSTKVGGETSFDPGRDKFTTDRYGLEVNTERYEGFAKVGYVYPEKKYKSVGLQLSYIDHRQNSYFGMTVYDATQKNAQANFIYQSIINNTDHKFRTGLSFLRDAYDEQFKTENFKRTEIVPGAFFEYTYSSSGKFTLVAGLRADDHNLFGFFITPRLHLRYQPVSGTTIRVSAGRGQHTANIFAENNASFVSSREVNIIPSGPGLAYGLNAEVAWNKGISVDQKFNLFSREAMLSVDFFRNDFEDQVVVDMEDPRKLSFYNLKGKSYSNSFQAELNFTPVKNLEVRMAYRYFDVKSTYSGQLLRAPLVANSRAFVNLAYNHASWSFDYTLNYIGDKRIPSTIANPDGLRLPAYSPEYFLMHAQVSKRLGTRNPMDIYVGVENLGNFFQQDAIIDSRDPFGPYFDASLVWGPISGRMFYLGWRYKIK